MKCGEKGRAGWWRRGEKGDWRLVAEWRLVEREKCGFSSGEDRLLLPAAEAVAKGSGAGTVNRRFVTALLDFDVVVSS